jgi:hypothetical protein
MVPKLGRLEGTPSQHILIKDLWKLSANESLNKEDSYANSLGTLAGTAGLLPSPPFADISFLIKPEKLKCALPLDK